MQAEQEAGGQSTSGEICVRERAELDCTRKLISQLHLVSGSQTGRKYLVMVNYHLYQSNHTGHSSSLLSNAHLDKIYHVKCLSFKS